MRVGYGVLGVREWDVLNECKREGAYGVCDIVSIIEFIGLRMRIRGRGGEKEK